MTMREQFLPGVLLSETHAARYTRGDTDWFANCRYGITFHWTAQTVPRRGPALPFEKAVDRFRLDAFMDAIDESGADYVIFTSTHALQKLPCPHPVLDCILPGRTTQRDLLGEIAGELRRRGKHLIVYYNHSCNQEEDPEWKDAVGYRMPSDGRLAANLMEVVRWMGLRYGEHIEAWWFDSPYSLDPHGPHNTVSTDMTGYPFPWERFTEAARAGHAQRLVTYNAGVDARYLYTPHQDYWAGEMDGLDRPPVSQYVDGLLWHGWTCLDDRNWVHTQPDTEPAQLRFSDGQLVEYLAACRQTRVPMSFNVAILQDGSVSRQAVSQLRRVGERLRARV